MNKYKKYWLFGGILILFAGLFSFGADLSIRNEQSNKEIEQFFKAKEYVFKRNWYAAQVGLQAYLKTFPAGKMRDEGLYWLAFSLNKQAREKTDMEKMIDLKEAAISQLNLLIHEFKESLWSDDALALRIEISGELVLIGRSEYRRYIQNAVETEDKTVADAKLLALNSLVRLEPETAAPILKKIVTTEPDPRIRKKCVLLLGKHFSQEVLPTLEALAQKDKDAGVRKEAAYWVGQIRIRLIPVELNYYAFATGLSDSAELKRVAEGKVNLYELPHSQPGQSRAKNHINRFFNRKLTGFGSVGSSRGFANVYTTRSADEGYSSVRHRINDFRLMVLGQTLKKSADRISGQMMFMDEKSGEQYYGSFTVDRNHDNLLVMRRDNKLAAVLLQLEVIKSKAGTKSDSDAGGIFSGIADPLKILVDVFGIRKKPVYYTRYSNYLGCEVLTTLQTTDYSSLQGSKHDFSLAKAEIPDADGTWQLTGYLIGFKKERRFLARMASLIDPKGRTVAVADEITVDVADPAGFKVKGSRMKKKEVRALLTDKIPEKAGNTFNLEILGCSVTTTKNIDPDSSAINAERINLGEARAEIPGPGGNWILTGYLIIERAEQRFVALDARLVDPGGKTAVAGEMILVPTGHPEKHKKPDIKRNRPGL